MLTHGKSAELFTCESSFTLRRVQIGLSFKYPRQGPNYPRNLREKRESAGDVAQKAAQFPADLAVVIDAWPTLPEAIRTGILAMVRAASG